MSLLERFCIWYLSKKGYCSVHIKKQKLIEAIVGGIINCIHTHGPVTPNLSFSCAKRIAGQVQTFLYQNWEKSHSPVAQGIEQRPSKATVNGSSPFRGTNLGDKLNEALANAKS